MLATGEKKWLDGLFHIVRHKDRSFYLLSGFKILCNCLADLNPLCEAIYSL